MAETYLPDGIPLPAADPNDFDFPFWDACRRHELVVQCCSHCGTFRHSPEIVCWNCQSFDYDWRKVSGKGTIYSFMNIVYPAHPALRERVPFNVVLVELSDVAGVRMIGNLVDAEYGEIRQGMPVEVYFEDRQGADLTLPLWKQAGQVPR